MLLSAFPVIINTVKSKVCYAVMPLRRYAVMPLCRYAVMPLCRYAIEQYLKAQMREACHLQ